MDSEIECLLFLRQNINELKRLGNEWGLSTDEINQCIDKSLLKTNKNGNNESSSKNRFRNVWCSLRNCLVFWAKIFALLVSAVFLLYICVSIHEPTGQVVGKALHPYAYPIFRYIRLATLPLHRVMNITYYYDSECIIQNPYYREPEMDCWMCNNIRSVKEVDNALQIQINQWISYHRPVLFKKTLADSVSFGILKDLYSKNAHDLESATHSIISAGNANDIVDLRTLFDDSMEERISSSINFHVEWHSWKLQSSKLLRTLFPRPKWVPVEAEVSLKKTILIDGPRHTFYELPSSDNIHTWYTQGSGSRKLIFSPVDSCKFRCFTFQTFLRPGDTVLFSHHLWKVDALSSGESISVGFIGSFSI